MNRTLISIIMAAYNAERCISQAIQSVLDQQHSGFELLIIDDGSTDNTARIVAGFEDLRISYFYQPNSGVSASRNLGLQNMNGDFFCFLDADDLMTPQSLISRLASFKSNPDLMFVGGGQEQYNEDLSVMLRRQIPTYQGMPRRGLVRLDPTCFINCGTWLIRRIEGHSYQFPIGWTHSEDLAFFLSISHLGLLKSIDNIVQVYRRHQSAMSDLDGLKSGYLRLYEFISNRRLFINQNEEQYFVRRVKRIMFFSYLRGSRFVKALTFLFARFH